MWYKKISWLLVVLAAFTGVGSGQNVNLNGYLKFYLHPLLRGTGNWQKAGSRVQLSLSGALGERVDFFTALDFDYNALAQDEAYAAARNSGFSIYPVESYVNLYFTNLDIRLGQQFIFWGKADWINPTDNINPWDFVNISAKVEDYRLPVLAARASYYWKEFTFQGVWLPSFQADRIPIQLPAEINGLPVVQDVEVPQAKPQNSQWAFKLDANHWNIDWSLSYFYGYDKKPTWYVQFDPEKRLFHYNARYERLQVIGGDFVTTFESFALKGEAAYFLTNDTKGTDVWRQHPHVKYVLGMDYLPTDNLTLNFQWVQDILLKYDQKLEEQTLQQQGLTSFKAPDKITSSLSSRIQYKVGDFTSLQLIGVYNLKDGDYFLLPILSHNIWDGVNIYAGATWFSGPQESPFGRNRDYSRAFIEFKMNF